MRLTSWILMTLAIFVMACDTSADPDTPEEGKDKGTVLKIDGLSNRTPAEWKSEPPQNRMRFAQFKLPKQKGDKDDAELVIFKGLGGSPKANIDRWKNQFEDAKAKDEVKEIKGRKAHYLDVTGTFLYKAQPFNPNAKTERKEDYRMLAVHLDGNNEIYHIKLTGPAKTVEHYKKGFDEWLTGLK